ncbi:hypothetical protein EG329_011052 [Mollisiaceae sp. DMI_Dod_QoI]|nr:hypothetical protein EG329_011052 [Helotiales sp. DMI_Dod_QoI]
MVEDDAQRSDDFSDVFTDESQNDASSDASVAEDEEMSLDNRPETSSVDAQRAASKKPAASRRKRKIVLLPAELDSTISSTNSQWPGVRLNRTWTTDDEEALRASWTPQCQHTLETTTTTSEAALWGRAKRMFECTPLDLFPDGEQIAATETTIGSFRFPAWSKNVCQAISNLLCCPAFEARRELVQHALRLAMWYRKQSDADIHVDAPIDDRNKRVWDLLSQNLGPDSKSLTPELEAVLRESLNQALGMTLPFRMGFLDCLHRHTRIDRAEKGKGPETREDGIVGRDVSALMQAWNTFAEGRPSLCPMGEYQELVRSETGQTKQAESFALKKEWIISIRREELRLQKLAEDSRFPDLPDLLDEAENLSSNPEEPVAPQIQESQSVIVVPAMQRIWRGLGERLGWR